LTRTPPTPIPTLSLHDALPISDHSPGALNAWLLLVTTKPPSWKDRLLVFPESPLSLGAPHEGFFYPDPLGFWAEVRHWVVELFRDRKSTRLNSSHLGISYAVFC